MHVPRLAGLSALVALAAACGGSSDQPATGDDQEVVESHVHAVDVTFPVSAEKDFDASWSHAFKTKTSDFTPNVDVHAHVDFKSPKLVGSVTWGKTALGTRHVNSADLRVEGHYDASYAVDVTIDGTMAQQIDWSETPLGGIPIPIVSKMSPVIIPLDGPLFVEAFIQISAACKFEQISGDVRGRLESGVSSDLVVGGKYTRSKILHDDFQFQAGSTNRKQAPPPHMTLTGTQLHLKGRCSLQPAVVILLESTVGMRLTLAPYVDFDADVGADKSFTPHKFGVQGIASTEVRVFGFAIGRPAQVVLFDVPVAE